MLLLLDCSCYMFDVIFAVVVVVVNDAVVVALDVAAVAVVKCCWSW